MGRPAPLSVALLICSLLVAAATLMTARSLALAADGPYYLVRILDTYTIFGTSSRYLGNAVREGPVLIGVWLGLTDTRALSILLGFGTLVVPALVWSAAILLARPQRLAFIAVALTAAVCASTTWFASISESVLSGPLTVLVAVLLWRPTPWTWRVTALALLTAAILVASYETAVATGALLAVWAAVRARRAQSSPDRIGGILVTVLSTLAVAVALSGSRAGANSEHSRSLLYFVASFDPTFFYLGLVGVAAVTAALGPWLRGVGRWGVLAFGCAVAAVAVSGLHATPASAFEARGGSVVAALVLQIFLFGCWATRRECVVASPLASWSLGATVLLVGAFLTAATRGLDDWSRSLDAFRNRVNTIPGVVAASDTLPPGDRTVLWGWTSASLSLVVRSDPQAGVLADSKPSWIPFPPSQARRQLGDRFTWKG